ncbi:hypothetical protein KKF34_06005 [Myxococcota bacterium]|nr:hypothetical protein [Myxococcota bacterium]MBU1381745.1 hypothetical protein [Myxococcota bacterium]MBU1496415.1 hypothetical protein [Myxococcota bacterium]
MKYSLIFIILLSVVSCNDKKEKSPTTKSFYKYKQTQWGRVDYFTTTRKTTAVEVTDKNIWVGTNAGLERYNIDGTGFLLISSKDGLPNDSIRALAWESNLLWVATATGLSQYNEGAWQNFELPVKTKINVLEPNPAGGLWVGADHGLFYVAFGRVLTYSKNVKVTYIEKYHKGGVLIGTDKAGLQYCHDGKCEQFDSHISTVSTISSNSSSYWVSGIDPAGTNLVLNIQDGKFYYYRVSGKVEWIKIFKNIPMMYTEGVLYKIQPCAQSSGNKLEAMKRNSPCYKYIKDSTSFPPKMTLVKQSGSNLLFGTESLGVAKWDGEYFTYFSSKNLVNRKSRNLALSCDKPSKTCHFTAGRESFSYTGKTGFIVVETNRPGWEFIYFKKDPEGTLLGIAKNNDGHIGIFRMGTDGKWSQVGENFVYESDWTDVYVNFAFFTKKHLMWAGFGAGKKAIGLYVFNLEKLKYYTPQNYHTVKGQMAGIPISVRRMSERYGHRYLASREGIIHLWRISGKKYLERSGETDGLNSDVINDVLIDRDGGLWAATDLGLCYKAKGKVWKCGESSILPDAGAISSFAYDEDRNIIYVSATRELYRIKNGKKDSKLIGLGNLLQETVGDIKLDPEGKLWIMHPEGISIIKLKH